MRTRAIHRCHGNGVVRTAGLWVLAWAALTQFAQAETQAQRDIREFCGPIGGILVPRDDDGVECCGPHSCYTCYDNGVCVLECRSAWCCQVSGDCLVITESAGQLEVAEPSNGRNFDYLVVDTSNQLIVVEAAGPENTQAQSDPMDMLYVSGDVLDADREPAAPSDDLCEMAGGQISYGDDGTWSCCTEHYCTVCDGAGNCTMECRTLTCCIEQGDCVIQPDVDRPEHSDQSDLNEDTDAPDAEQAPEVNTDSSDEDTQEEARQRRMRRERRSSQRGR